MDSKRNIAFLQHETVHLNRKIIHKFPLNADKHKCIIIGRDRHRCHINLKIRQVSRLHARVDVEYDEETKSWVVWISPISRRQPSYLNGEMMIPNQSVSLQSQDTIEIGGKLFRFVFVPEFEPKKSLENKGTQCVTKDITLTPSSGCIKQTCSEKQTKNRRVSFAYADEVSLSPKQVHPIDELTNHIALSRLSETKKVPERLYPSLSPYKMPKLNLGEALRNCLILGHDDQEMDTFEFSKPETNNKQKKLIFDPISSPDSDRTPERTMEDLEGIEPIEFQDCQDIVVLKKVLISCDLEMIPEEELQQEANPSPIENSQKDKPFEIAPTDGFSLEDNQRKQIHSNPQDDTKTKRKRSFSTPDRQLKRPRFVSPRVQDPTTHCLLSPNWRWYCNFETPISDKINLRDTPQRRKRHLDVNTPVKKLLLH